MRSLVSLVFAVLLLGGAAAGCAKASAGTPPSIHVEDAEARVMPNGAGAFYARIVDDSDVPDRLDGVEVAGAADAQLHETVHDGDIVSMREAKGGLEVPARGTLVLAKGGKHAMFFGMKAEARDAERARVTLHLARAGAMTIEARIQRAIP